VDVRSLIADADYEIRLGVAGRNGEQATLEAHRGQVDASGKFRVIEQGIFEPDLLLSFWVMLVAKTSVDGGSKGALASSHDQSALSHGDVFSFYFEKGVLSPVTLGWPIAPQRAPGSKGPAEWGDVVGTPAAKRQAYAGLVMLVVHQDSNDWVIGSGFIAGFTEERMLIVSSASHFARGWAGAKALPPISLRWRSPLWHSGGSCSA
jgi:hypothetical protein